MGLDLSADVVTLTQTIVDVESVSRNEQHLADLVEAALRALEHLEVTRIGNSVVARTDLGLGERVVIAGHLDTVRSTTTCRPATTAPCSTASAPAT